jgi:hypothetical protein
MQRVEQFTASSPSSSPSSSIMSKMSSSPSVSKSTAPVIGADSSTPHTMVELCYGSDYLSGDATANCACNLDGSVVKHQTGDGKVLVDMCSDGSTPTSHTGDYCKVGSYKLVYELSNNTISYRKNALTAVGQSVPAVTRRWCSVPKVN